MACIGGHAEIVELLLKQDGVDINVTDGLEVRNIIVTSCSNYYNNF